MFKQNTAKCLRFANQEKIFNLIFQQFMHNFRLVSSIQRRRSRRATLSTAHGASLLMKLN